MSPDPPETYNGTHLNTYFSSAREELLFRVGHRDAWLKLQLLAQVVLWALAKGVKIAGAGGDSPLPEVLAAAPIVACVFAGLYYVEDGLIHRLSLYAGNLSQLFIASPQAVEGNRLPNWDASIWLKNYATGLTLVLRLLAQLAAFIALPLVLLLEEGRTLSAIRLVHWIFLAGAFALVVCGYVQRRGTAKITARV